MVLLNGAVKWCCSMVLFNGAVQRCCGDGLAVMLANGCTAVYKRCGLNTFYALAIIIYTHRIYGHACMEHAYAYCKWKHLCTYHAFCMDLDESDGFFEAKDLLLNSAFTHAILIRSFFSNAGFCSNQLQWTSFKWKLAEINRILCLKETIVCENFVLCKWSYEVE